MIKGELFALQTSDWNQEWKRIHETRRKPKDAAYWDTQARTFDDDTTLGDYYNAFTSHADVRPGESIFDMGCGTGSLCIEYAHAGHKVLGADFSCGMLAEAKRRINKDGAQGVSLKLMSWDDDWESHGIQPNSFDVAIASRSISTADMAGALFKLSAVARRRCFITLSTGCSPRVDARALDVCGIPHTDVRDFQYALNMLVNAGYFPSLKYITSTRDDSFESLDDAVNAYRTSLGNLTEQQMARLIQWLRDELVANEYAGKPNSQGRTHKPFRLAHPRQFHWAFISWDV